jgi:hypothetical protein
VRRLAIGVAFLLSAALVLSACGASREQRQLGQFAIDYVDHARNDCCATGIRAYGPHVRVSKIDRRWATVWLDAKNKSGEGVGVGELVLYRKPTRWTVFAGPGTGGLGCDVPKAIQAELQLIPDNCKPAEPLPVPGYIDCGRGRAQVEPAQIVIACGDGNFFVTNVDWSFWGDTGANGVGIGHQNDCTPDCAGGHFHTYRVAVELARAQTCGKKNIFEFTRLKWRFIGRQPHGVASRGTSPAICKLP